MILTDITLIDFGTYAGQQTIRLKPEKGRNIVLFGGKNGAGKSTLLEAIRLCFYGQTAYSDLGSRLSYENYLLSKIHSTPTAVIQPTFSSIIIAFEFGESDGVHSFSVNRSWERTAAGRVAETFEIEKDGKQYEEVSADHWQDFIRDLLPPGVSQLFFFDGEKIQQLAEDTSDQKALSEAVKSLLGIDLIERLHADLAIYRSKTRKPFANLKYDEQTSNLMNELLVLDNDLASLVPKREILRLRCKELRELITSKEETLVSSGGSFAKRREKLLKEEAVLRSQIEHCEEGIRDLASSLLPFALCPELTARLKMQLLNEETASREEAVGNALTSAKATLLERLSSDELWQRQPGSELRQRTIEIIEATIRGESKDPDVNRQVHQLSLEAGRQVIGWIEGATGEIKNSAGALSTKLENLYRAYQRIKVESARLPAEEVIRPLLEELNNLYQELGTTNSLVDDVQELLAEKEAASEDKKRAYAKIVTEQDDSNLEREKLERAIRVQAVLEEYKQKLIERRISILQRHLTEAFNLLSRKKDAISKIEIDAKTFVVTLRDRRNKTFPKSRLSAGEKQIYAISVLWALAKTSGRPLPMIVDTPLARLDADHRLALARHYFPTASHQTLILSTDTEIDQTYFNELRPFIAKSYRLDFLPDESRTTVQAGYFWEGISETN